MNDWIEEWKDKFLVRKWTKDESCAHDGCSQCHGTGRKPDGSICVHMISCRCSRCSPRYLC